MFTEFPSNPLLKCPDLLRLTALAKEFRFLLVVDDTIGNFANLDLFHSEGASPVMDETAPTPVTVTGMAGVSDVTGMAGVSDVTGMAGVSDVAGMAGVSDVTDMAGVSDVAGMAGVSDVAGMAGVSDVTGMAGIT